MIAYHPNEQYRLHVGGIPAQTSRDSLWKYFSQFGTVLDVQTFEKPRNGRKKTRQKLKGFCLVTVNSQETLSRILSCKQHTFEQRQLICTEHLSGQSLQDMNRDHNLRRAVIKGVPPSMDTAAVRALLDSLGIQVELLFPFNPDSHKRLPINSHAQIAMKPRSFSVMLSTPAEADKLVAHQGILTAQGIQLRAEYYRQLRRQALLSSSSVLTPSSHSPEACPSQPIEQTSEGVPTSSSRPGASQILGLSNRRAGETVDRYPWEWRLHWLKPTQHSYHSYRPALLSSSPLVLYRLSLPA